MVHNKTTIMESDKDAEDAVTDSVLEEIKLCGILKRQIKRLL